MLKTYQGSCHCGDVKFEAELDISAGTGKCNCSICTKKRLWAVQIRPEAFSLVAGSDALTDYQFNSHSVHHLFCKRCGISAFGWSDIPQAGGKFYGINVACLDGVDIEELVTAPVTYYNGRDDQWMSPPAETRHL